MSDPGMEFLEILETIHHKIFDEDKRDELGKVIVIVVVVVIVIMVVIVVIKEVKRK